MSCVRPTISRQSFVFPLVVALGFDSIWWGVINVIVMEIGMLTPPIGLNVFVVHGMVPGVPMSRIFSGVIPFFIADFILFFSDFHNKTRQKNRRVK